MKTIKLSQKEIRLILGVLIPEEYSVFVREWEFVDDKGIDRLEAKLSKQLKEE